MAVFQQETRVAVWRNNIPVAGLSNVPVRIRPMSYKEASELGGSNPSDSFSISTMVGTPDIQRRDLLVDQVNIDPTTSSPKVYRVFGIPHVLDSSYVRLQAETPVGTQNVGLASPSR
jgi:hypothetical protein